MKMEMKNSFLYLAWKTAWRMRCCPPDKVLYGEKTKDLQRHLESCAYCRADLEQRDHYVDMQIFSSAEDHTVRTALQPGQLWSLKKELGGWGIKKRYYSPPLVVVTKIDEESVTVLQCCGDMALSGSDDIPFQNNMIGFIQSWNQYSLCLTDLDTFYGTVIEGSMAKVVDTNREQNIVSGSLLWFFRQMEVETGYFFSSRAVQKLLKDYDTQKLSDETEASNLQKMHSHLCNLGLTFQQSLPAEYSMEDLLFNIQIPDELFPLAASDNATLTDFAICLVMHNEQPEKLYSIGIDVTHSNIDSGFLNIVGRLQEIVPERADIFIRLQVGDTFFEPVPGEFGIEKDLFWALFEINNIDVEKSVCVIRVVYEC